MNVIAAIVIVIVPGYLPALALARSAMRAVVLASPVCVVLGGLAGLVTVLLQAPVAPIAVTVFLAANVAAGWMIRRRPPAARMADADPVALLLFGLAMLVLTFRPPQPIAWDARSIWWFKASWFEAGGDVVVDAVRNPIMTFSHPEYPIGVPSFLGAVWGLVGGENLELAMAITAVLTAMALAALVATVFGRARIESASLVIPVALAGAIAMQGQGLAAAGYVDVLCGCLVALAFVGFIRDRSASAVAVVAWTASSLTKSDGLFFAVLLSAVALVVVEHRLRFAVTLAVAAVPALMWMGIVRLLNPDLATDVAPGGFVRLLLFDRERWTRLWDALPGVWSEMWPFLFASAVATVGLVARVGRSGAAVRLAVACLTATVLVTAGLVTVYAAGLPDVHWWLDTSLDRASVTPKALALITIAVCVDELGAPRSNVDQGELSGPESQPVGI